MRDVDPVVAQTVEEVTNRFGVDGLNDMIALAKANLARAEAAAAELATLART